MAFQGIDMLYDSRWGQNSGGLRVKAEPAPDQPELRRSELAVVLPQQILEGVGAATRPQLLPETELTRKAS